MQIGMVGLGKMGANMARRLMKGGHECAVFDLDPAKVAEMEGAGAKGATDLKKFMSLLQAPRVVWMMVPAGAATEGTVNSLTGLMSIGDTIIDGGNSYYKDDVRRAKSLLTRGIHYCDAGTSGGVWGLERGYCLMVGGEKEVFDRLEPIFITLAPGTGSINRTPGASGEYGHGGEGLSVLRPCGGWALCENDSQRH